MEGKARGVSCTLGLVLVYRWQNAFGRREGRMKGGGEDRLALSIDLPAAAALLKLLEGQRRAYAEAEEPCRAADDEEPPVFTEDDFFALLPVIDSLKERLPRPLPASPSSRRETTARGKGRRRRRCTNPPR